MDWPGWIPAWVGALIAIVAFIRGVLSDRSNKQWRKAQESELRATRSDWSETFTRMVAAMEEANAIRRGGPQELREAEEHLRFAIPTSEELHAQGAQLSARLSSERRVDDRLIVMNLGPGGAQLREVKVTNDPGALVEPTGVSPGDRVELVAGEEYTMPLAISMATPMPIEVWLQWRDGTGDIKEREQKLM